MIFGHLASSGTYAYLLANPTWRWVFEWLQRLPARPEPGVLQLQGDDIYVNIHGYETLPADKCRFESHRKYVDLQFCIAGGELIDWTLASSLSPAGPYDTSTDVQFYDPRPSLTTLQMVEHRFAIFFPDDAHRPKRSDGVQSSVFKLVIKVAHHLCVPS